MPVPNFGSMLFSTRKKTGKSRKGAMRSDDKQFQLQKSTPPFLINAEKTSAAGCAGGKARPVFAFGNAGESAAAQGTGKRKNAERKLKNPPNRYDSAIFVPKCSSIL